MTDSKIILGIDPGTRLMGFGIIRIDQSKPHSIDMGVFDLRKIDDPFERLTNIHAGISELIETHCPTDVAIEAPFLGKNAQSMLKLGRAQGAAIIAATTRGIPVFEYAPRKAKIAICGNGDASKEQVATMVGRILSIEMKPEHFDATDALAIALCHYYNLSGPLMLSTKGSSSSWAAFLRDNPDRVKK